MDRALNRLGERKWKMDKLKINMPWECTDCLDTGAAGRGTQMNFCNCRYGNALLDEAMREAARGLDEFAIIKGIKRERSR
jgi:hypothetical protein